MALGEIPDEVASTSAGRSSGVLVMSFLALGITMFVVGVVLLTIVL